MNFEEFLYFVAMYMGVIAVFVLIFTAVIAGIIVLAWTRVGK